MQFRPLVAVFPKWEKLGTMTLNINVKKKIPAGCVANE